MIIPTKHQHVNIEYMSMIFMTLLLLEICLFVGALPRKSKYWCHRSPYKFLQSPSIWVAGFSNMTMAPPKKRKICTSMFILICVNWTSQEPALVWTSTNGMQIARALCISTDSERLFSCESYILDEKRNCICATRQWCASSLSQRHKKKSHWYVLTHQPNYYFKH